MAGGEEPLVFAFIMLWRGKEDSPQPIAGQDEKGQPFGQPAAEERLARAWQAAHHYKRRLYLGLGQVVVKALPQSCHIFSQGTCHNRSIITMTQRMCQDAGPTGSLDIISPRTSLPRRELALDVVERARMRQGGFMILRCEPLEGRRTSACTTRVGFPAQLPSEERGDWSPRFP